MTNETKNNAKDFTEDDEKHCVDHYHAAVDRMEQMCFGLSDNMQMLIKRVCDETKRIWHEDIDKLKKAGILNTANLKRKSEETSFIVFLSQILPKKDDRSLEIKQSFWDIFEKIYGDTLQKEGIMFFNSLHHISLTRFAEDNCVTTDAYLKLAVDSLHSAPQKYLKNFRTQIQRTLDNTFVEPKDWRLRRFL
jgi:uncharacterized protein YllA (UPF0747 family)